jgi:cellulose biosynthesis protein BcsQ
MTALIAVGLCGLPPAVANRIATWLQSHPDLGLQVAFAADSAETLLAQLAAHPTHAVVIDGRLGLEGVSLAQELVAAGYRGVCLAGTADRRHVRQRASEAGLATCPDYEPARLAAVLRNLLGFTEGRPAEGRVIAFHSPRGGAGTTILLLHLAQVLNARGQNVAVVEVGGGGSAIPLFGLRPAGGWAELLPALQTDLAGDPDGPAILARALVEAAPGLYLFPSGGPAIMDQIGPAEVEAVLQLLPACGFSHILVDTSPELTLPTAAALAAAHRICLVALPDNTSAFRLVQSQSVLSDLRIPLDRIQPVINRVRENVDQRLTEALEFLRYRPVIRIPEESRPPLDATGRFAGFRPGSGAAKAIAGLIDLLLMEVTPA